MRPCIDVFKNDLLKITATNAVVIKENVIAVLCEILKTASVHGK